MLSHSLQHASNRLDKGEVTKFCSLIFITTCSLECSHRVLGSLNHKWSGCLFLVHLAIVQWDAAMHLARSDDGCKSSTACCKKYNTLELELRFFVYAWYPQALSKTQRGTLCDKQGTAYSRQSNNRCRCSSTTLKHSSNTLKWLETHLRIWRSWWFTDTIYT